MEEYALFKIHFDRGYKPDIYIENRSENTVLNAYYSKKKVMKLIKKEILNKNLTIFLVATRDHLYKKKGKDIFDKYFTSDGIIPVPTNISEKPISKEDKLIRYCYNNILPTVLKRKTTWLMTFTYKRLENIRMFYRIYKKIKILFK